MTITVAAKQEGVLLRRLASRDDDRLDLLVSDEEAADLAVSIAGNVVFRMSQKARDEFRLRLLAILD